MTFQGRKYLYDKAQGLLTGIPPGGALTQFATDGNANPTAITFPAGRDAGAESPGIALRGRTRASGHVARGGPSVGLKPGTTCTRW